MIHRKVLTAKGCTTERLREIFTCDNQAKAEFKIRKRFEDRIASRITEGVKR